MSVTLEPAIRSDSESPVRHSHPISAPLQIVFIATTVLYAIWFAVHYRAVYDPDIWWHLRAGDWVLRNHSVTQTDWLSASAQGKPWFLYSWLFDTIIASLYRAFGLFGPIILYPVTMVLLIAATLWALVREFISDFWRQLLVAALSILAIAPILSPRPGLFTVLFFTVELFLIARAENTASIRPLYVLPFIFVLWANTHIQFIYGLFAIALYAAEPLFGLLSKRFLRDAGRGLARKVTAEELWELSPPSRTRWLIVGLCAIATLINPYSYKLYEIIADLATQTGQYSYISELHSPTFRSYNSFAELFIILGAWFVLGTRKTRRLFLVFLLLVASAFAFRTVRDVWFGVLASVFVTAAGSSREAAFPGRRRNHAFVAITASLILLGTIAILQAHPLSASELWQDTAEEFPLKAAEYVRSHRLRGPLYNDWYWGGFLIWSLPDLPVYVDSRTNVLGDETLERSIGMWAGSPDWASDAALAEANLVVANPENALTSLLRYDTRFRVEYEDSRAVVFVRQNPDETTR